MVPIETQGQADHTIFTKFAHDGRTTVLIVYVDDIIVTSDYAEEIKNLKEALAKEFDIKDLGPIRYFLGIEEARSRKDIVVSQRKYTLDLLTETRMLGCELANTPMESDYKLKFTQEIPLMGLIYLTQSRPDLSFPVSVISQFMSKHGEVHRAGKTGPNRPVWVGPI